ncbi:MAG: hypothetical protein SCI25_07280 [Desulfuromonadales bacterium]|nr:hypothetical protein [Desulfuromonadales bacterium]MDW7757523.1 hypothetical protein [Desulfuromonadales bacterium]
MHSNLKALHPTSHLPLHLATVLTVREGEALLVEQGGEKYRVAGHLHQTEYLKEGDAVMTMATEVGLIVCGRLRAKGEEPAPRLQTDNGQLNLEAATGIRLQVGDSWLEIHKDGSIRLNGRQITSIAHGRMRLQGTTIEIN